jgi:hypothetical protein
VPPLLSNRCFTLSPGLPAVISASVRSKRGVAHVAPALHLPEEDDEEDVEEDDDDGDVDGDGGESVQRILLGLGESRAPLLPLLPILSSMPTAPTFP